MRFDPAAEIGRVSDPSGWNFTVAVDGREHATRALTLGDLRALESAESDVHLAADHRRQAVAEAFVEPRPDLSAKDDDYVAAIIAGLYGYVRGRIQKNTRRIVADVAAAVQTTAGAAAGAASTPASGS